MNELIDTRGWNYATAPPEGDQRKIVWLEENGFGWIGIRIYESATGRWMANGEPERARVLAWMDLPKPPLGHWQRGKLVMDQRTALLEDAGIAE